MIYDKKTGDVKIIEKTVQKKDRIIRNFDDLKREKTLLFKEVGLTDENQVQVHAMDTEADREIAAEKLREAFRKENTEFDLDPTKINVFSRDGLRVDIGLIIMRPPIFMHMRERDANFLKARSTIMNEHYQNMKQYVEEFEEVSRLNEDLLSDNSYASNMNLDNFPTHESLEEKHPETGEPLTYAAASKNFANVDPAGTDVRSLHYAPEDRVYLIFKNRHTGDWEFPTGKIKFGQTFLRAKQNLFQVYSKESWKVKYFGTLPLIHTVRDFTLHEKTQVENEELKGIRTYFFGANHLRGLPEHFFDE